MNNKEDDFFDSLPSVVHSKDVRSGYYDLFKKLNPVDLKTGHSTPEGVLTYTNDEGFKSISIPVKEFMCAGESEPFEHPNVFLTMGNEDFILCPYCSTRFDYKRSYKGTDI